MLNSRTTYRKKIIVLRKFSRILLRLQKEQEEEIDAHAASQEVTPISIFHTLPGCSCHKHRLIFVEFDWWAQHWCSNGLGQNIPFMVATSTPVRMKGSFLACRNGGNLRGNYGSSEKGENPLDVENCGRSADLGLLFLSILGFPVASSAVEFALRCVLLLYISAAC